MNDFTAVSVYSLWDLVIFACVIILYKMSDYYKQQEKTTANSGEFLLGEEILQKFPVDGFYIGDLRGN